jgi:hypothetical protein
VKRPKKENPTPIKGWKAVCGHNGYISEPIRRGSDRPMVDLWANHCWVRIFTNCVVVNPAGIHPVWAPKLTDIDTQAVLWKTATGECPAGVLADRIEEMYPESVELAELLRKGSGVGRSGKVLEADDGRPDQSQVRH